MHIQCIFLCTFAVTYVNINIGKGDYIMMNAVTGTTYSGQNAEKLLALGFDEGDLFVTFKQAISLEGISGKALKGIKKAATLVRFGKATEKDENGKEVKKPIYFSVFDLNDVLSRKAI